MAGTVRPEHLHYDFVENLFFQCIAKGDAFLFNRFQFDMKLRLLSEKLNFPYPSLLSLIRNLSVRHVKKHSHKVKARIKYLLKDYQNREVSIVELSKKANYPPYLFARIAVEAISCLPKKTITDAMRDPKKFLVSLDHIAPEYHKSEQQQTQQQSGYGTRLAYEVDLALQTDPMYGPMFDKERSLVGVEYEVILEHQLRAMNISFETEEDLRDKGASRTPDVLLSCPIGIPVVNPMTREEEWKVVCWIDSKALFGDVYTHTTSVLPQAESYVHRFGPGLVIYWFGHAPIERLADSGGDIVVAGWELPCKMMLPTGKVVEKK